MTKDLKVSKKDFWEERYNQAHIPWDIGQVAPAFIKHFNDLRYCEGQSNEAISMTKKDCRTGASHLLTTTQIAVLGCGRGHDAFYLAEYKEGDFEVYGFDFAEGAIKYCNELKQNKNLKNVSFCQLDFFELVKDKKWKYFFNYVIEHTSLAAIDPHRRKEYADLIKYLLKPNGKLIGLFFVRPKELKGPPFGIEIEEIRELFRNDFIETEKLRYEECLHSGKLQGDEWFGVFEKNNI